MLFHTALTAVIGGGDHAVAASPFPDKESPMPFDIGPYIPSDYTGSPITRRFGSEDLARRAHTMAREEGLTVHLSGCYVSLLDERQYRQFDDCLRRFGQSLMKDSSD
jgi:hypothetical protein